jgi:hypothetical protein
MNRVTRALSLAVFLSAAATAPAYAADAQELAIKNYTLTADKVARYFAGAQALTAAMKSDPALKAEEEAASNEPDDTLAQMRATVAKHPKLYAFFQRQGLSVDDSILLPLALFGAAFAAESDMPEAFADTVSQAQINFVRQNKDLVAKGMQVLTQAEQK